MPTLIDTQRLLWRLITAPEGVSAALAADAGHGDTARARLTRTVGGDAAYRLDIYANMYFFRLLDVLKEDYPATRALLGEVTFHNLVTDYVLRHPPSHFSIREAGRHLPELLAGHGASAGHPCCADLARLERALNDAFDAADAPPLSAAALSAVPQEEWPALRFTLHPAVRLLECGWPVHNVRTALDHGDPVTHPQAETTRLCVWRQEFGVFFRALDAAEFTALAALERGIPFAEVCATVAELSPGVDAPQRLAAALTSWLANGWIAQFRVAS